MTKLALNIERDDLERRFPHREVWWLPELAFPGNGRRITWHSRRRGAANADLHADSAAELAVHIEKADKAGEEEGPCSR